MATAFAVYCADDTSLTFYKRDTVPAAGATFEGKIATAVYTGIETDTYSAASSVPWNAYRTSIEQVEFKDRISPVSITAWFYKFQKITSLDVSNLDVSLVTRLRNVFGQCWYLRVLDLSSWDTHNVTDVTGMFNGCQELTTIYVSERWKATNASGPVNMFSECYSLIGGSGTVYDEGTDADSIYACIDTATTPGYFTYRKYYPPETRAEYLIQGTTWYDIAESVRGLVGSAEPMSTAKVIATLSSIKRAEEVSF